MYWAKASRAIGQALNFPDSEPAPDLMSAETAVDAGLGALGPVAGPTLRAGGRAVLGLKQKPFNAAVAESNVRINSAANARLNHILVGQSAEDTARLAAGRTPRRMQTLIDDVDAARTTSIDTAIDDAIKAARELAAGRAGEAGRRIRGGVGLGGLGAAFSPEPFTGALIAAGVSELVVSRAVPALLRHPTLGPKIARWALNKPSQRAGEATTSFAALCANETLGRQEREAVDAITSSLSAPRERQSTLRFDNGVVRHGSRLDGTHPDDDDDER